MMNQRPIFDGKLVKRFEYDIHITKYIDNQPNEILDKLVLHPIEVGNRLEFKSKKDESKSFSIPIQNIIAITIPEQMKGSLKKEDVLLEIEFCDSQDSKTISFNVLDIYVQEILNLIKVFQTTEQEYWDTIDLQYNLDGIQKTTKLYYRGPFLSEGEELLWINTKMEGIANKRIRWLEALTNFRAIYYDFTKHDSGRIPLSLVDDVVVTNQKRTFEPDRVGTFTENCDRIFAGTGMHTSYGTNRTIGDVHFMKDGKPTVIFLKVSDPYDVAGLAKAVIKQLFTPVKAAKKTQLPMVEGSIIEVKTSETGEPLCPYCGNINQIGSAFCNRCGFALR